MVNFTDLLCNKSLGGSARRYLAPFRRNFDTLLTSVSFPRRKRLLRFSFRVNNVRNALLSKLLAGFLYSMTESWKNLKDTITFLPFRRFLCVRIEIDQLLCVFCWVVNHTLSVSCKKNHWRFTLVIWFALQLEAVIYYSRGPSCSKRR